MPLRYGLRNDDPRFVELLVVNGRGDVSGDVRPHDLRSVGDHDGLGAGFSRGFRTFFPNFSFAQYPRGGSGTSSRRQSLAKPTPEML